ncbi:MAG: hypothetical protein FWH35_10270 [Treponema sp.]|nr:hypothetical protein [Treponema sp.]
MPKIKIQSLFSPLGIFILYIVFSALAIMAFRFIIPGEAVPLACFAMPWRIIRFLSDFLHFFPALVLSALVIPFGFIIKPEEKFTPFSAQFMKSLSPSIITAIFAAALYCLLSFVAIPIVQNNEANLRFQGRLYRLARERAEDHADREEWAETAQYVAICETIWPMGPEISKLRAEVEIQTELERLTPDFHSDEGDNLLSLHSGSKPVNVTEALELSEKAFAEERYFDAHWLATLGGQLASTGSTEEASARRLAGRAWSMINSLAPNARETQAYSIFRLKRDGYEALVAGEWIRSFYIFQELLELAPDDPDAKKYFAASETGLKNAAFFIDEIEMSIGTIQTGAVFSFPFDAGRLVMRVASLSTFPDTSYGIGAEIMAFDHNGSALWGLEAPYVKILPLTPALNENTQGGRITVLMRALDRADKNREWLPVSKNINQRVPGGAQIAIPVSWDNFILLSKIRRGLSGLSTTELRQAAIGLVNCGYQSQVFEAELIRRFVEPLFLLPLGIFAIVLGWRYRALKRARYIAIPMLGILPVVFNGVVHFCRGWLNNLGIWAVVSVGFINSAIFFGIGIIVLLVLSLITLAAQHG